MARPRSRSGRTIDFKSWSAIPSGGVNMTASGTFTAGGGLSFSGPATLLRARGELIIGLDETSATGDQSKVGMGLAIVSTDAFTLGVTAFPDPSGEPEYPWMWWNEVSLLTNTATAGKGLGTDVVRVELDTKAMRKIKPGETLTLVIQYTTIVGNPIASLLQSQIRVLVGT